MYPAKGRIAERWAGRLPVRRRDSDKCARVVQCHKRLTARIDSKVCSKLNTILVLSTTQTAPSRVIFAATTPWLPSVYQATYNNAALMSNLLSRLVCNVVLADTILRLSGSLFSSDTWATYIWLLTLLVSEPSVGVLFSRSLWISVILYWTIVLVFYERVPGRPGCPRLEREYEPMEPTLVSYLCLHTRGSECFTDLRRFRPIGPQHHLKSSHRCARSGYLCRNSRDSTS